MQCPAWSLKVSCDGVQGLLSACGFGFSRETVDRMLAAADTNHDGVIQYQEFVPAMLSIMESVAEVEAYDEATQCTREEGKGNRIRKEMKRNRRGREASTAECAAMPLTGPGCTAQDRHAFRTITVQAMQPPGLANSTAPAFIHHESTCR